MRQPQAKAAVVRQDAPTYSFGMGGIDVRRRWSLEAGSRARGQVARGAHSADSARGQGSRRVRFGLLVSRDRTCEAHSFIVFETREAAELFAAPVRRNRHDRKSHGVEGGRRHRGGAGGTRLRRAACARRWWFEARSGSSGLARPGYRCGRDGGVEPPAGSCPPP